MAGLIDDAEKHVRSLGRRVYEQTVVGTSKLTAIATAHRLFDAADAELGVPEEDIGCYGSSELT